MALNRWTIGALSLAVAALTLAGCGRTPSLAPEGASRTQSASFKTASTPKNFLWGVSTAGYQWEGYDDVSNWAAWVAGGNTAEKNPYGANGFKMYDQDIKLSKGLGANTFRTSIEWGRIEPKEGQIDREAVAHYHRLLDSILAQGMTPVITLHHFSHPAWIEAQGGWENKQTPEKFAKYAAFVAKEFGSKIEWYLTFNEPNTYLLAAYVAKAFPPGKASPVAGLRAMRNMVRGHGLAYDAVHANDAESKVSFNMYVAEFQLGLFDQQNQDPAIQQLGSDTAFMDEVMATRNRKIDYASLDYYCKFRVKLPFVFPRPDTWEVYPEGMYNALKRYHEKYNLPILIGENGMATNDLEPRADRWTRSAYMVAHIKQMQRAMAEGVNVVGYIHWSITDNWEWGSFSPRFGLYTVDCRNGDFRRVKGDGVDAYKAIIRANGVTPSIERQYPQPGLPAPWLGGGEGTPVSIYKR